MRKKVLLFSFPIILSLSSINVMAAKASKVFTESSSTITSEPAVGSIKEGLKEFKNLSRHEKKSRFKELKRVIKEFKEQKKAGSDVSGNTLLLALLAIFIPPLAVYLHEGETNSRFWTSVLLTIIGLVLVYYSIGKVIFLGTIPGIVYALIVILGG